MRSSSIRRAQISRADCTFGRVFSHRRFSAAPRPRTDPGSSPPLVLAPPRPHPSVRPSRIPPAPSFAPTLRTPLRAAPRPRAGPRLCLQPHSPLGRRAAPAHPRPPIRSRTPASPPRTLRPPLRASPPAPPSRTLTIIPDSTRSPPARPRFRPALPVVHGEPFYNRAFSTYRMERTVPHGAVLGFRSPAV